MTAARRGGWLPPLLLASFAAIWLALAWDPWYREDWALENVLVGVGLLWLVRRHRVAPFSNAAYVLVFVFGVLHEIGAHHTYSEVPYDAWARAVTGQTVSDVLDLTRNHFDRLAHFAFGLLLFRPVREYVETDGPLYGVAPYLYPVALLATMSLIFELIEWGAAVVFGDDLGQAYLGTQGDVWDAQKDMALALLGSVIAAGVAMLWQGRILAKVRNRGAGSPANFRSPSPSGSRTSTGSSPPAASFNPCPRASGGNRA